MTNFEKTYIELKGAAALAVTSGEIRTVGQWVRWMRCAGFERRLNGDSLQHWICADVSSAATADGDPVEELKRLAAQTPEQWRSQEWPLKTNR
ncbi:hypothetical protein [Sagittula sp. S175]|uniref:hypothetical protein n=1 Tax=Sagittula sp. S175 TaxID=3415129 RepID=UPI003C7D4A5A